MNNLFPTEEITQAVEPEEPVLNEIRFGRSWRFDFEKGDFVMTPTGKVIESKDVEAWLEWCQKALRTIRYRFVVYSRNYGQEFEDLIGRGFSHQAQESEIKRIATECLMVDLRTAAVENFIFEWKEDQCFFSCMVSNVRGETGIINGSVVSI